MENNGYERFGKYLLSHLGIVDNPDDLDWRYIVNEYKKITVKTKPGLMYINWLVATHFGLEPNDVRIIKKQPVYTTPKYIVMYLATSLYKYTQFELRDFYTVKNHSSVSIAITRVEGWLDTDKYFKVDIEQITNKLLGYEQIYQKPIRDTIGSFGSIQKTNYPQGDNMSIDRNRKVESSD